MQPSGWLPCAAGELTEFAGGVRRRRRLDRINRLATFSLVALVAGVIAFTAGQRDSSESAQIDCHEVQEHLSAYITGSLPDDLAARIDNHLAYCLDCSALYHQRTDITQHARNNVAGFVETPPTGRQVLKGGTRILQLHKPSPRCTCPDCGYLAPRLDEDYGDDE